MVAHLKIFLLIAVISAAVYANSLQNSFHFDDQHFIVGNPYIRDISNIPSFFITTQYSSFERAFTGHYRPLLVTSYAINYATGGLNPAGYHVVNLLFHIGSAFLVYLIIGAMLGGSEEAAGGRWHPHHIPPHRIDIMGGGKKGEGGSTAHCSRLAATHCTALAAALLFAVHPFNSEVVNYITARSSVMCSFFYLLSFYCWVKYRQLAVSSKQLADSNEHSTGMNSLSAHRSPLTAYYYYVASLLAFVLAMLTKEIAIMLPVTLFLYDLYFHKRAGQEYSDYPGCHPDTETSSGISGSKKIHYLAYLPYVLLVILPYLAYRLLVFGRVVGTPSRKYYTNLLTQSKVLLKYLQLMFFPSGLTIDHDIAISTTIHDIYVVLSIISLLVLLGTAYFLYKRGGEWRVLSFFVLWFFITLLPTTIIPLNAILQENRGYLAGIVFPGFVGLGIGKLRASLYSRDTLLNSRKKLSMVSPQIFLLLTLSIYSFLTIQRNSVWKNDYTLWSDAVDKAPASARAHDNLGLAYIGKGEYDLAIAEFQKTLELQPRYYLAHYNAGVVYQLQNRVDTARSSYEACIRINPGYFRAYYNLGIVYKKTGELDKAIEAYERAIALDPRHPFVYNNLGVALMEKGDPDRAAAVFKKAIEIDPRYEKAHFNLGNIYYRAGKYGLAAESYRAALRIKPDYREAGEMLKTALAKL